MDHLEAAALAAAPSTIASIANPDIKINSLDSSQISGSFHDEASLKESLARSQSDTLNSLKISIDLQSGLTAPSPGQKVRRGSLAVRHRSPHASQERYMPYSATSSRSPRSPLSSQASTSPFLVHSPPPPISPSSTDNFLSAPPLFSSPSYAFHNVLLFGSPSVQSGPARSPPHFQASNRQEQHTLQRQQQQQEQASFGRHVHRHNSNEGVFASESWAGRSITSESFARSPSSYPQSSHFPPSWSLPQRQASYHDHPISHPDNEYPRPRQHEQHLHRHHPASQHHPLTLSDRQGAGRNTRMSQDHPERIGYQREDKSTSQQQKQQRHLHHSHQQHHHHQHQTQHSQHQARSGRPQDRYQEPYSEHPVDRVPQYFHASNTSQAPTSMRIHPSSASSAARNACAPFFQPGHRSSRHTHSHGQDHHSQQQEQQHAYASQPTLHHSMTSEHAERTSVSSHVNADEPFSSSRGTPYGVSRTSSSSHLPPHSSLSTVSSLSSSASAAEGSVVRSVPAEPITSPATVATTASGEIKMTRRRRRPNESYSTIIIKAIRNSPLQRLKLSEIYDYVSREIPTMDGNDKGWQNTVRHNLSHNKCFRRIVIKDEDLPSESADEDDGDSKPSTVPSSKQAKRGKRGCWVLVPENLGESMSSSRPKKSSTDQRQSPGAPGAGSGGSMSSTSPKRRHHTAGTLGEVTIPETTMSSAGRVHLSPQLSKDYALSHPYSGVMDIDRNVASMVIAEQQLHQSGRHHGLHIHSSQYAPPHSHSRQHPHYSSQSSYPHPHHQQQQQQHHHQASFPYLPPHYTSSSLSPSVAIVNQPGPSSVALQPFTPATHLGQHDYNSSGDEKDHDSESEDDDQSDHSVLSADRENDDDDYEEDETMDVMENDSVSHSSSSRQSRTRSPSASSLSATPAPMEIEETDGGNGGLPSSSSPTTDRRRRPGMSIQNMLN